MQDINSPEIWKEKKWKVITSRSIIMILVQIPLYIFILYYNTPKGYDPFNDVNKHLVVLGILLVMGICFGYFDWYTNYKRLINRNK